MGHVKATTVDETTQPTVKVISANACQDTVATLTSLMDALTLMNVNHQMCTLAWELAETLKETMSVPAPKAQKVTGKQRIATRFLKSFPILLAWLSIPLVVLLFLWDYVS
jgi:hypothetical protein